MSGFKTREASIERANSVAGAGNVESATITMVVHVSVIGVWAK
jgi:hypothetical protein